MLSEYQVLILLADHWPELLQCLTEVMRSVQCLKVHFYHPSISFWIQDRTSTALKTKTEIYSSEIFWLCRRHYVFGLFVCECVLLYVQAYVLLAEYLTNQWMEFHQTFVDDVVEDTDELIRF